MLGLIGNLDELRIRTQYHNSAAVRVRLVGSIYELSRAGRIKSIVEEIRILVDRAAANPERWTEVVTELIRVIPGTKGGLQVVDPSAERGMPAVFCGWDSGLAESYAAHYGAINPWLPTMVNAPALTALYSEARLPSSSFMNTEFYSDWLSKAGEADASTGIKLEDSAGRFGVAALHYDVRRANEMNEVISPVLSALGPRIRRALDINRASRSLPPQTQSTRAWISAFSDPALLVGEGLLLIDANQLGQRMVESGGMFALDRQGRLVIADGEIRRAVVHQAGVHLGLPRATESYMRTAPSSTVRDAMTWNAFVSPVELDGPLSGIQALFPRKYAVVLMKRSRRPGTGDLTQFLRKRGFTPAEIKLVTRMDGSEPLSRVAERMGIAHETARSQLKAAFGKLGVSRQSELIALLVRIKASFGGNYE